MHTFCSGTLAPACMYQFINLCTVYTRYAYILYSSTLAPVRPTKINDNLEEA